jgi:hypothetical protein
VASAHGLAEASVRPTATDSLMDGDLVWMAMMSEVVMSQKMGN